MSRSRITISWTYFIKGATLAATRRQLVNDESGLWPLQSGDRLGHLVHGQAERLVGSKPLLP